MGTVEDSQNRTPFLQQISFGVGHVIFDVANLLLSSYRLVFLMRVVGLSASNAGWITLYSRFLGALIIRPMAGYLCDKVNIPVLSRKHGKKMTWHLIGTVLTPISMLLFFANCLTCSSKPSQWQLMVYHVVIGTCLPASYVFIEIAYLSLVPFIAKSQTEAVKLNALRMAFTFFTGIVTYLVTWAILGRNNQDQLTSESSMDFTVMSLIVMGIGLFFAVIFHVGTKEPIYDDTSAKRRLSVTMKKNSPTPYGTRGQSMVYMGNETPVKDVQKKERMCDQIVESLKTRGKNTDDLQGTEEENSPVRKSGFRSRFINALFSVDEENEIVSNQASGENAAGKAITKIDEASFCGVDDKGVDNKGFDCRERKSRPSPPDQITVTNTEQGYTDEVESKSTEMDGTAVSGTLMESKPLLVSTDPKSPILTPGPKTVRAWFKDPHLYKIAIIYACARHLQELSNSYLPLFLTNTLKFEKESIAYLPLVMLVSATVSTGITEKVIGRIGSKWSFILAALLVIGSCVWFYFITQSTRVLTYPAAALLGFGFSAMFVNALSFATDLIGDNKSNSGFVFSFLGVITSLSGGALVSVIQNFFPEERNASEECEECGDYVRLVFLFLPGSLAAVSLLIVLMFQASHKPSERKASKADVPTQTDATEENCHSGD